MPRMCSTLNNSRQWRVSILTTPIRTSIANLIPAPCRFRGKMKWWKQNASANWMYSASTTVQRPICWSTLCRSRKKLAVFRSEERCLVDIIKKIYLQFYLFIFMISSLQKKQPLRTQPIPIPEHLLTTSHSVSSTTVESW